MSDKKTKQSKVRTPSADEIKKILDENNMLRDQLGDARNQVNILEAMQGQGQALQGQSKVCDPLMIERTSDLIDKSKKLQDIKDNITYMLSEVDEYEKRLNSARQRLITLRLQHGELVADVRSLAQDQAMNPHA